MQEKIDARKVYHRYVLEGLGKENRKESYIRTMGDVALGDEAFIIKIPEFGKRKRSTKKTTLSLSKINQQVCNFYQVPESLITSENRSHLGSQIRSVVIFLSVEQAGCIS